LWIITKETGLLNDITLYVLTVTIAGSYSQETGLCYKCNHMLLSVSSEET